MRYIRVTSPDINNGTGCRVTVWVAGCSHHCPGCHNPESWDYDQGVEDIYDEIAKELEKPYIQGTTFSGGDPLSQSEENLLKLRDLMVRIIENFPDKDMWLFTGDKYEDIHTDVLKNNIIHLCDVIVDGSFKFPLRDVSLPFRGSSNQRIILINEEYPYEIEGSVKESEIRDK